MINVPEAKQLIIQTGSCAKIDLTNHQKNEVTGYILAGGKSSRMGTDKGLILFKGKPIIQHIINQLQPAVSKVVIVSDNAAYSGFGFEVITDIIKNMGPAGGIYSALAHSHTTQNFVLSCDMPFVNTAAIEYIIQHTSQSQIILPVHKGLTEPMFGVYTKSCLTLWRSLIQEGILKLHHMAARFDLLKLDTGSNPLFKDPLFVNINTPDDFEKALIKPLL